VKRIFPTVFAMTCLMLIGSTSFAQTARARIADTPIRAEADLTSATVATLHEGDSLDIVDARGAWYRVLVPGNEGKPQVGYVLARLIEIANTDGAPQSIAMPSTTRAARPVAQAAPIAPTPAQIQLQRTKAIEREKAAEREQTLKAKVDALQAEVSALQNDEPKNQVRSVERSQPTVKHPQIREGLWFNGGLGFGALSCSGCDFTLNGATGGLSLGRTINDRVLLGVGTTGYYKSLYPSTVSVGTLDARLRFYPVRASGFFVTGGMGLGHLSVDNETQFGVGAVLGLGWDIRVGSNVSLTPFWNGIGVATSNSNASVGQLGFGITVH
jgi:hypothetical protein